MPKRINKAIELLEEDQMVYYTGAPDLTFEGGKAMAGTWADYINISMEHRTFDLVALDAFMKGLVAGGPTASGHKTPAVVIDLPVDGGSEETVRANTWMFKQALARGVHGILMVHAETPGAVKAFVESCRYAFHSIGVGDGLDEGRRGSGGQGTAANIWGISTEDYLDKADVWPLNPDGEIMLGLKIENKRALANSEASAAVPGISFAEWGPGDMGMSLGHKWQHDPPYAEEMLAARTRVKAACDDAGVFFLNGVTTENVVESIEEGVRIGSSRSGEEATKVGRAHQGRTMPV